MFGPASTVLIAQFLMNHYGIRILNLSGNPIGEYGITAYPRIIEVIESEDETGYKVVPTFESGEGKF